MSDRLFQYLLESGTNFENYFLGLDGWQVPGTDHSGAVTVIMVRNATNTPTSLTLRGQGIDGTWGTGDNGADINFSPTFGPYALVLAGVQLIGKDYNDQCSVEFWSAGNQALLGYATIDPTGLQNVSQPPSGNQIIVGSDQNRSPWTYTVTWAYQS